MRDKDYPVVTFADRLARYGLAAPKRLGDLKVKDKSQVVLSPTNERMANRYQVLKPSSIDDLKNWIGIPPGAVAVQRRRSAARKDSPIAGERVQLVASPALGFGDREMETRFVWTLVNNTSGVELHQLRQFERLISQISIVAFIYRDIYVGKNSTLYCSPKTHVLLARHITLDRGARLEMQAPISRIDCAGIEALDFLQSVKTAPKLTNIAAKGGVKKGG